MNSIRVSKPLLELIQRTAIHCELDVSDMLRRTCRGINRGRKTPQVEVPEEFLDNVTEIIKVRDLPPTKPKGRALRQAIARRCFESLAIPNRPRFIVPEDAEYIIENEEE